MDAASSGSKTSARAWLDPAASRPRPEVVRAMSAEAPPQKGARFAAMFLQLLAGLQTVIGTRNQVLLVPGSGTLALESAIVNFIRPTDVVVALVNGVFGERGAHMLETFGTQVHRVTSPWGTPLTPDRVASALQGCSNVAAIAMTHVESSTGVVNPVEAIAEAARQHHPDAPVLVDAVPSIGAAPLEIDSARLDVVAFSSGKALGGPVGCCGGLVIHTPHVGARQPRNSAVRP